MDQIQVGEGEKVATLNNLSVFSSFESFLGDCKDKTNLFSFDATLALDEKEKYPAQQLNSLNDWKLNDFFIPQENGGKLKDLQDLLFLTRLLARRDLNCAIAYGGTFLGAIAVWVAGSLPLRKKVSEYIREGKKIAFAITEKNSGSDLLASEVNAVLHSGKYEVSGEKWLYNHASKSNFTTILAKTDTGNGPRSCSLLLVPTLGESDKNSPPPTIKSLHRIHTVGLKGLDLGGISLNRHLVSEENLIGKMGAGLELSLIGLQVTKTLCASLSLGSLDTLLRTTLQFCLDRVLYKNQILQIPIVRTKLVNTFLDIVTAESLCWVTCRTAQVLPTQFGLLSSITKAFVPALVEFHTKELASLLGARSYITSETEYRIFQKQARDNAIISIFEGNTYVNYQYALQQMKIIFSLFSAGKAPSEEILKQIYEVNTNLTPIDFSKLSVVGKGRDDLAFGLVFLIGELDSFGLFEEDQVSGMKDDMKFLIEYLNKLRTDFIKEDPIVNNAFVIQTEVFNYAHRYAIIHAVSAAASMVYHNRHLIHDKIAWKIILKLILKKAASTVKGEFFKISEEETSLVIDYLLHCNKESYLFSLFPFKVS